jgi:hypothetical protein
MRWRWLLCVCALGACGRIDFDSSDATIAVDAGCVDIPGLRAYWPMNGGDITGSTLRDHVGGHHGEIIGSPPMTLGPGKFDEALDSRATSMSHVEIASLTFPTAAGAANSVSLWFYREQAPSSEVLVYIPEGARLDLWLVNGDLCFNSGASDCWGTRDVTFYDRWVHVVAVFKNGIMSDNRMYVDGQAISNGCLYGPTVPCNGPSMLAGPFDLGGGSSYPWHGRIDEVRLYDRELTQSEIALLAANTGFCGP